MRGRPADVGYNLLPNAMQSGCGSGFCSWRLQLSRTALEQLDAESLNAKRDATSRSTSVAQSLHAWIATFTAAGHQLTTSKSVARDSRTPPPRRSCRSLPRGIAERCEPLTADDCLTGSLKWKRWYAFVFVVSGVYNYRKLPTTTVGRAGRVRSTGQFQF